MAIARLERELRELRNGIESGAPATEGSKLAETASSLAPEAIAEVIDERIAAQDERKREDAAEKRRQRRAKQRQARTERQASRAAKVLELDANQTDRLQLALSQHEENNEALWPLIKDDAADDTDRLSALSSLRQNIETLRSNVSGFMSSSQLEQYEQGLPSDWPGKNESSPIVVPNWLGEIEGRLRGDR